MGRSGRILLVHLIPRPQGRDVELPFFEGVEQGIEDILVRRVISLARKTPPSRAEIVNGPGTNACVE